MVFFCKRCDKERIVDFRSKSSKVDLFESDTSELIKHKSR